MNREYSFAEHCPPSEQAARSEKDHTGGPENLLFRQAIPSQSGTLGPKPAVRIVEALSSCFTTEVTEGHRGRPDLELRVSARTQGLWRSSLFPSALTLLTADGRRWTQMGHFSERSCFTVLRHRRWQPSASI